MAPKKQVKKKTKAATASSSVVELTPSQRQILEARKAIIAAVIERQAARRAQGCAAKQVLDEDMFKFRLSLPQAMWNVPIADFRITYNAEEPDAGPESSKASTSKAATVRAAAGAKATQPTTTRATRANHAVTTEPMTQVPAAGARALRGAMRGTVRRNAVAPTPFRTALRNGDMPRIITNDMITMNPEIRNADGQVIAWDESDLADDAEVAEALQRIKDRIRARAENAMQENI